MRLIDADALKEELNSWAVDLTESKFPHYIKDDADCIIDNAPTIDPVIRCKDCRYMTEHYDTDENAPYWTCSEWDSATDYDGFCHYADGKTK